MRKVATSNHQTNIPSCGYRERSEKRFIVGLLGGSANWGKPFSSAYFIDAASTRLMCHKENQMAFGRYKTCPENRIMMNPIVLRYLRNFCHLHGCSKSARLRVWPDEAQKAKKPHKLVF